MQGDKSAFIAFIGAAILIIGHFRYGPIRPAFVALQKGRVDVARELVQAVTLPSLLSAQSLAYLHWIRGVLATADPVNLAIAEQEMSLAVDGQLRTSNDRCLATATLAEIVALSHDLHRANSLLDKASQIPHSTAARDYLDALRARFSESQKVTKSDSTEIGIFGS